MDFDTLPSTIRRTRPRPRVPTTTSAGPAAATGGASSASAGFSTMAAACTVLQTRVARMSAWPGLQAGAADRLAAINSGYENGGEGGIRTHGGYSPSSGGLAALPAARNGT